MIWARLIEWACGDLRARAEEVRSQAAEEAAYYERAEELLRELHPGWSSDAGLRDDLARVRAENEQLRVENRELRADRARLLRSWRDHHDQAAELAVALGRLLREGDGE